MLYKVIINSYIKLSFFIDAEAVDLNLEDYLGDVNNITGVLKLWFRELPDPLFTKAMCQDFINAASKLISIFLSSNYSKNIMNITLIM